MWNIARITKMWQWDKKQANAVGKRAPGDLLDTRFHKPFICKHTHAQLSVKCNKSKAQWHCIVCSPPQARSPSITVHPTFPSGNHHAAVYEFCCLAFLWEGLNPVTCFPLFSDSCQSVLCIHESVSIWLVSLFRSLDFTYKWDHMVLVFLWLAYFTRRKTLQVHLCCCKG